MCKLGLILITIVLSIPGFADLKRRYPIAQVHSEIRSWIQSIDANKGLNAAEKHKEMSFVTRLRDRLDAAANSELTLVEFKSALQSLDKESRKGAGMLYPTELHFMSQNLKLVDELEPNEDPILVMKSFMQFASIEKCKEDSKSVEEFESTRTYINRDSSLASDPDDLDDAARFVDEKIFHSQERVDL